MTSKKAEKLRLGLISHLFKNLKNKRKRTCNVIVLEIGEVYDDVNST